MWSRPETDFLVSERGSVNRYASRHLPGTSLRRQLDCRLQLSCAYIKAALFKVSRHGARAKKWMCYLPDGYKQHWCYTSKSVHRSGGVSESEMLYWSRGKLAFVALDGNRNIFITPVGIVERKKTEKKETKSNKGVHCYLLHSSFNHPSSTL